MAAPLRAWRGPVSTQPGEPVPTDLLALRIHPLTEPELHAAPRLLAPAEPMAEAWRGAPGVQTGRTGAVTWTCDGQWLHASISIDDALHPQGLIGAARQAYEALFALMAQTGFEHTVRLWNYFAQINRETESTEGLLERYRQFNIGRQQAFVQARRGTHAGAPAACALGTDQGPLTVHVLAGRQAPVAIENPRQVSAYDYPSVYGPTSPTFSRAAWLALGAGAEALLISGTASIVGHASLHLGDVRAQTRESLANIAAVLQAARARSPHFSAAALDYTLYLRHAADLPAVRDEFGAWLASQATTPVATQPATPAPAAREAIYLRADVCRAELLVEIEAHGLKTPESPR